MARLLAWLWGLLGLRSDRLWKALDARPVVVFVGLNGTGKSLAAVASLLPVLDGIEWRCQSVHHRHSAPFRVHAADCEVCEVANAKTAGRCELGAELLATYGHGLRKVLSTCRLQDEDGFDHPLYVPFREYAQLLTFEHGEIFADEIAGIADASGSAQLPVQVINHLHKLRHFDVTLRVTTPAFARCALPIRQAAQVVVLCRSYVKAPARGDKRRWASRCGFLFAAFDAAQFETFSKVTGTAGRIKPIARAALWRPGHRAMRHYDTLDSVISLGYVTDAGMCMACGGSRSRPRCGCSDDQVLVDVEHAFEVIEEVSRSGARVRRARVVPLPLDGDDGDSADAAVPA